MDAATLLTVLGGAGLPSVLLEIVRTVRARSKDMREEEERLRRAPAVDASFVVHAAKEATDLQKAVMDRLLAQIGTQQGEIQRLHEENAELWQRQRKSPDAAPGT